MNRFKIEHPPGATPLDPNEMNQYRRTEKNIGVPPERIPEELRKLCHDTEYAQRGFPKQVKIPSKSDSIILLHCGTRTK
jgi:hypothetical protein